MAKSILHPAIKRSLAPDESIPDVRLVQIWREKTRSICKPCWELKYCPYGPLVEDFPLPPISLRDVKEHNKYLRDCIRKNRLPDGSKLEPYRRRMFEDDLHKFDESAYPDKIPDFVRDASCRVFGHMCPVFFVAEPLTETKDRRHHSRTIPREAMLQVVRRDGQICQKCHRPVPDNEVEFDHIIPFSRGGTSTANNLRLICYDCNRSKGDSLEEILSGNPIEHLYEIRRKKSLRKRARKRVSN